MSKAFSTDLRLLPRNLMALCLLMPTEDTSQCETYLNNSVRWSFHSSACSEGDLRWRGDPAGPGSTAPALVPHSCWGVCVAQKGLLVYPKPEMEVPRPISSRLGRAEVTSSIVTAFESNFLWFNIQRALLRLGTIISIYSQKPGELFVKRQSNKSSTVCKIQTFVLQVKYLDRNHYWVLLQQPCQKKRERGLGNKTQRR